MDFPSTASGISGGKPLLTLSPSPDQDHPDTMNQIVWSLMYILEQNSLTGTPFNPEISESYTKLYQGIQAMISTAVATFDSKMIGVGGVMWYPSRAIVPAAFIPGDGQTANRAIYPGLIARIGDLPTVSEGVWTSDATKRASYSLGDGATTFRFPDYNGKYSTNKALFLRGDGGNAAAAGVIQDSDNKAHHHNVDRVSGTNNSGSAVRFVIDNSTANAIDNYNPPMYDSGGSEARPKNVAGVWCIRAY